VCGPLAEGGEEDFLTEEGENKSVHLKSASDSSLNWGLILVEKVRGVSAGGNWEKQSLSRTKRTGRGTHDGSNRATNVVMLKGGCTIQKEPSVKKRNREG